MRQKKLQAPHLFYHTFSFTPSSHFIPLMKTSMYIQKINKCINKINIEEILFFMTTNQVI